MLNKFIHKKKTKFILSVISAIINLMGRGLMIGLVEINVYILSYIREANKWVDMQYGNLMLPIMSLFLSLFAPLSGILEKYYGPVISIIISNIIIEICFFLYYLQQNIWLFYVITLIIGFGSGLSANILVKNACLYYPKRKGLINGGILSFTGISAAIYFLVGEQIVNPKRAKVKDEIKEPYYDIKVAIRVKYYFIFAMIVLPITTLLTLILFFKYDPKFEQEEENQENIESIETPEKTEKTEVLNNNINNESDEPQKNQDSPTTQNNWKTAKIILKSFRLWRNILIAGLLPFYSHFIQSTFRAYVVLLGVDTNVIFYLGSIIAFISFLFGPIWAALVDKFGFQPIIKIIGLISALMSVFMFFFIAHKVLYIIGLFFLISSLIGIMATMTPHLMNIFGMENYLTIGGFTKIFNQLSSFTAATLSIIISVHYKNADELKTPYKIVIAVGGIMSIGGFILTFFENDEKFKFPQDNLEDVLDVNYTIKGLIDGEKTISENSDNNNSN